MVQVLHMITLKGGEQVELLATPALFAIAKRRGWTIEADAKSMLGQLGFENYDEEVGQARKVLSAAALTYVASVATSIVEIIRLVSMTRRD